MKFKSRKDPLIHLIFIGFPVFLLGTSIAQLISKGTPVDPENIIGVLVSLTASWFLLFCYFNTSYSIKERYLFYKSGPIQDKIEIHQISTIIKGNSKWSGIRPALATNGLTIKFGSYGEVYISPETNDSFIEKILELNNQIEIIES